jgi:mycothiol system anti-sigma-R factor
MTEHTCDDALNELYRYIDGELDEATRVRISAHLDDCSPCLEAFDFEAELRRVVASRCQERVPDELRDRILNVLRTCDREGPPGTSEA